jgi:hypothetical protein
MKVMTRSAAERKRRKAVDFLRRIGNGDLADEFDSMDAEGYAAHRGAELIENPSMDGRGDMPRGKTKAELEAELGEANDYIEELESKLDQINGIAAGEDEEDDDDADGDEGEDDDEPD